MLVGIKDGQASRKKQIINLVSDICPDVVCDTDPGGLNGIRSSASLRFRKYIAGKGFIELFGEGIDDLAFSISTSNPFSVKSCYADFSRDWRDVEICVFDQVYLAVAERIGLEYKALTQKDVKILFEPSVPKYKSHWQPVWNFWTIFSVIILGMILLRLVSLQLLTKFIETFF